jgi:hypothetical protein
MWRKGNPCILLVGMEINKAFMENSTEGPQKIKNRTLTSGHTSTGHISKGNQNIEETPSCSWKQPNCPTPGKWIKKMWLVHSIIEKMKSCYLQQHG